MTKVKIFVESQSEKLENEVNEFIRDKKVSDMKFTSDSEFWSVLVMYED